MICDASCGSMCHGERDIQLEATMAGVKIGNGCLVKNANKMCNIVNVDKPKRLNFTQYVSKFLGLL